MIVQGGLIGPAVKHFGESRAMIVGLVFGVAGFAAFGLAATGLWFLAGIPLLALWGIASAATLALMSRHVGASEQGQLQGANASLMGIASLIGPGIFTQSFALFDRRRRDRLPAGRAVPARRGHARRVDRGRGLHDARD